MIIYFVEWGKDNTFTETKVFYRRRDAFDLAESLHCCRVRVLRREDNTQTPDQCIFEQDKRG